MIKNKTFWATLVLVVLALAGIYFGALKRSEKPVGSESPAPSVSVSSSPAPLSPPRPSPKTSLTPTGNGQTTFIDEKVPWELLLSDASCELKGEIKFVNEKTYDNQDAIFIYKGVDHPGRNIFWKISPAESNLEIGPNIFNKVPIPNGQSLLGVFAKGTLGAKKYTLTAVMQYGRLVDDKGKFVTVGGNVRVSEKPCQGQTTVVLP